MLCNVCYYDAWKFWYLTSYLFQCNRLNSPENIKELFNNLKNFNSTNETALAKVHNLLHSQSLTACYRHFPYSGLNSVSFCIPGCNRLGVLKEMFIYSPTPPTKKKKKTTVMTPLVLHEHVTPPFNKNRCPPQTGDLILNCRLLVLHNMQSVILWDCQDVLIIVILLVYKIPSWCFCRFTRTLRGSSHQCVPTTGFWRYTRPCWCC